MYLLKRNYWWAWLLLLIASEGTAYFVLGALLNVYNKDAWYANWKYWLIGLICLIFPAVIMLLVFVIQISVKIAQKLEVPGSEIYASPYTWILCIIIPIIGWVLLCVLAIYITVWPLVMLYRGKGERYI